MHAQSTTRRWRILTVFIPIFALAGCGDGDGPISISNTAATPLPDDGGEPFDSGLLINGDFEAGVAPWIGNAANVVAVGGNLVNSANVTTAGQPFDVNLSQVLTITQDETYTLTFKARSDGMRTILAGIGLNEEPFTNITDTANLTAAWQSFEFEFTATGFGNANSRVLFDMGADTGLVLIDDVSLVVSTGGGSTPGTPIDPEVVLYATDGDPDLVIPDDYSEITPFGSGSVIDPFYAEDETYSPVLSVFSGTGYGANIAQVGFIGFAAGFAGAYETLNFKVKDMPNFEIFVKLFDGVDTLRINLTSSAFSEALTDGWYQVSIPLSRFSGVDQATGIVFESDDSAPMQFTILLTDIGFSGMGTGGPADPFDSGLLTNGDFEAGVDPWLAGVTDPIGAANVIDDGGNNVYFVDVTAAGNSFDVNLSQKLTITPDETYTLTFKARSNVARSILAGIGLSDGTFANTTQSVNLSTGWQTFTVELTAAGFGDANSRVLFDLGAEVGEVYIDDVSLVVSTGGGTPPFDPGLLTNGDFEAGVDPWLAGVTDPIGAANVIDDGGNNVYFVDVTAAGNAFDVNLSQKLTITPDETYTLTFKARSNVARSILAGIGLSDGTFANTTQSVNLTTGWQTFTVELTAAGFGDANSRVLFDLGAEVGEVYIDDVSLVVSTGGGTPPFDPGLLTNGDFEAGVDPWLAGVTDPIGAANVIDDGGNNVYFVDVAAAGNAFDVNLSQKLTITPDETYTLTFKARSNVARSILAGIGLSDGTFANTTQSVNLTTDWQTFTVELTAAGFGDANSRVLFDLGAEVGEVYIDDVSLVVSTGGGG